LLAKLAFSNIKVIESADRLCIVNVLMRCLIDIHVTENNEKFVCLLGVNGTFSTIRLYRAIEVGRIPRRAGRQYKKYHAIKQRKNITNQDNQTLFGRGIGHVTDPSSRCTVV